MTAMPPSDNFFVYFTTSTTELMTRHSDIFQSMGLNLFRGFAIILIVWYGTQIALSGGGVRWDKFASLIMTISFYWAMITCYNTQIPGIGYSFHSLITDQGLRLAEEIELASIDTV